ncbi:hypothetical protein [Kosakonia sp.]|uniref:hypothetical protein n=1 Tax=Kosakonia sp. TaxID=1916651 RepID=UPI0028ACA9BB|nr:hypothetical protein [Kosakonia sp.]
MRQQLASMTIIELVRTANNYATSIKQTGVYSDLIKELSSRLEALNLAYIAQVRTQSAPSPAPLSAAIPEGYVLVPQELHIPAEAMEGVCAHCGDGGHMFGEFTDGILFVGEVDYGDGKKIYGLHVATADYPDEGCATICEFEQVKGVQS